MSNTLTLHQGGTGEREIAIESITVPDLWHVAQYLISISRGVDLTIGNTKEYADMILECWHLAHAMKDHLQQLDGPRSPERIEIARKPHTHDRDGLNDTDIVLVFIEGNNATPFVTWESGRGNNVTFQGHYFESIIEAVKDFKAR